MTRFFELNHVLEDGWMLWGRQIGLSRNDCRWALLELQPDAHTVNPPGARRKEDP